MYINYASFDITRLQTASSHDQSLYFLMHETVSYKSWPIEAKRIGQAMQ